MPRRLTVLLTVAAALVAMLGAPARASGDADVIGGNTAGLDGILQKGCQRYYFAYTVQVPTDDWSLEVSIVDRRGLAVASFAYIGSFDPTTQTAGFSLCRGSTVPGKFRIRSVLTWYDDPSVPIPAYVPVTKFRLARP